MQSDWWSRVLDAGRHIFDFEDPEPSMTSRVSFCFFVLYFILIIVSIWGRLSLKIRLFGCYGSLHFDITVSVQASNSGVFFSRWCKFFFLSVVFHSCIFSLLHISFLSLPSLLPSPSHHLFNISRIWGYSCMHGSEVKNHTFTSWVHLS